MTIANVSLLFETFAAGSPVTATGSFIGKYEQPGANCPAGGVKLEIKQPGITTSPVTEKPELDNGEEGNAFICFVSANNYVFPTTAPTWALSNPKGIWKD